MLHDTTLLLDMSISRWYARKFDKAETRKLNDAHGTNNAARVTKDVFDGNCLSYKKLDSFMNSLNVKNAEFSLPWSRGVRILPVSMLAEHQKFIEESRATMAELLDNFCADYYVAREHARTVLNGMWKESDYSNVSDLRERFRISVSYLPVPSAFTSKIDIATKAMLDKQLENDNNSAINVAMSDAWQRLYTVVQHFQTRLATPGAIFRDSLITNVRECCDVLKVFNVAGDTQLEDLRLAAETALASYDPATLRDNAKLRSDVAQTADGMLATIRTIRKIAFVPATKPTELGESANA